MRALVVFESMYGNTRAVAAGIAAGLRATHDVTLLPLAQATRELVGSADLIVVGGPTHMHGMSSAVSRRLAAQTAREDDSGLNLDPDADGPGVRRWLSEIGAPHALAAAFDTRADGIPALTGHASRGIARLLRQHGCRLLAPPESFLVSKQNALLDGEAERARVWGATLGASALDAAVPAGA